MENLGALGVSSTTLNFLDQEDLEQITSDPEKEIPYVARLRGEGDTRVPEYETIPREEWERRKTALNARDQISQSLDERFGEHPYSVAFTTNDQSPTDFGVEVRRPVAIDQEGNTREPETTLEELEGVLPAEMEAGIQELEEEVTREGIPVDVVEAEHKLTYDLSKNYKDIPGGAAIEGDIGIGVENGTLCAPFYSNEYGIGWTTAGHVVKKEDGAGNNEISQDNGATTDPFGESRDGYWKKKEPYNSPDLDYAFVEKQQEEGASQWITSADGGEREFELTGIVTNEELENKVGENYTLKGQGRTTGRQSGTLEKTAGNGTQAIETDWEPEGGDSGGPVFYTPNSDEAYIAGILFGYVDSILGDMHAKSTTAETTEVELDGYFLWS